MKRSMGMIVLVGLVGTMVLVLLVQFAQGGRVTTAGGVAAGAPPASGPGSEIQATPSPAPPEGTPSEEPKEREAEPGGSSCTSATTVIGLAAVSVPLFLALAFVRRRFFA